VRIIVNWLLSAVALLVVAHVVPGFHVAGITSALWAALVIGLINATLGRLLKFFMFPLTLLSFGLFSIVLNAAMLELASWFVTGFRIRGFFAAFIGAIVLSLLNIVLRWLVWPKRD
jgi:putative membrane protein